MKKRVSIILAVLMSFVLLFSACSSGEEKTTNEAKSATNKESAVKESASKSEESSATDATSDEFDPQKVKVAIMTKLRGHPVMQIVQTGFIERAKELGYTPEIISIDGTSIPEYIAAGEAAMAKGVTGIVIMDDLRSVAFQKKAAAAGVNIISIHFKVEEDSGANLDANICCNAYDYGLNAAAAIGNELKVRGKTGKIAITQGSFNSTENDAAQGLVEGLKAFEGISALFPTEEGFDQSTAIAKASAIIQSNAELVGAFGTTGSSPITWASAMKQTGRTDLVCIGMDYTEANVDLVNKGEIFGIVAQPLYEESRVGAELLDRLMRGEKLEKYYWKLDAPIATKENIAVYQEIIQKVKELFN